MFTEDYHGDENEIRQQMQDQQYLYEQGQPDCEQESDDYQDKLPEFNE